jgi:hypothetical protein
MENGRGLYRLADAEEAEHPDLAEVAARALKPMRFVS